MDDLFKAEDLHPDLVPYLETDGAFPMIRHPLIYSVPHGDMMNRMVNTRYAKTKERIENLISLGNFSSAIFSYERPYRLDAFYNLEQEMEDAEFWNTLREVWLDSENIYANLEEWINLWESGRDGRHCVMTEEDNVAYGKLPDKFKVYRGFSNNVDAATGLSWTTDYQKALWFANRFNEKSQWVAEAVVEKDAIMAFFVGRGENEVVAIINNYEIKQL